MGDWRVGGDYDRPIPRRIVESAGVPRDYFGMRKMGGGPPDPKLRGLSIAADQEFKSFYKDYVPAEIQGIQIPEPKGKFAYYDRGQATGVDKWLRSQYGLRTITESLLGFRNHHRRRTIYLYTFHWGYLHLANRYKDALKLSSPMPNEAANRECSI